MVTLNSVSEVKKFINSITKTDDLLLVFRPHKIMASVPYDVAIELDINKRSTYRIQYHLIPLATITHSVWKEHQTEILALRNNTNYRRT